MQDRVSFSQCVVSQMAEKGFGKTRISQVVERFNGLADGFEADGAGPIEAAYKAAKRVLDEQTYEAHETAKRAAKQIEVQGEMKARLEQGLDAKTGVFALFGKEYKTKGFGIARAAISTLQADPRFKGVAVENVRNSYAGKYWSLMASSLDHFGKGAFGRSRADENMLADFVDEVFGTKTGNTHAADFAASWQKVLSVMVKDFNEAGGSMRELDNFRMPQKQNPVHVLRKGGVKGADWIADHMRWLDWDKMRWPSGKPIAPDQRVDALKHVYETMATDGAIRIDETKFRGAGRAVGNQLDNHRFLVYKDGPSWREMHAKYGDGNVFDVLESHVQRAAHNASLVRVFGPNPQMAFQNVKAMARKRAAEVGGAEATAELDAVAKNVFEPMFETYMRVNAVDPHSKGAAVVSTTSNILTSALLGSVPLLAVAGDLGQTIAIKAASGMPLSGTISHYIKAMSADYKLTQQMAAQNGYVFDSLVAGTYATQRFNGIATHGPSLSRYLADAVMRLSLLNRHTEVARAVPRDEVMGYLYRNMDKPLDELPFAAVMRRYGIEPGDWDAIRKNVTPTEVRPGMHFLRPLDILNTSLANKNDLYVKLYSMIDQESRYMVPGTTLEGQVTLRGTERPDTLRGVLMHSFSMYKNFPVSFTQMYGRYALSMPSARGRLGFVAGLGVSTIAVGALGVQLRELAQGREPLDMTTGSYWAKSIAAGGGLSIWGDFLTSGVNEYGNGPEQVAAGPLAGVLGDTTKLAFGDGFAFVKAMDRGEQFQAKFPARAAEFARRYTPGTSLWWARLALQRKVWDNLDEFVDPANARRKQAKRVRDQKRNFGNDYYWAPGS